MNNEKLKMTLGVFMDRKTHFRPICIKGLDEMFPSAVNTCATSRPPVQTDVNGLYCDPCRKWEVSNVTKYRVILVNFQHTRLEKVIGWGITPNQIVLRLLMVCAMLVLGCF